MNILLISDLSGKIPKIPEEVMNKLDLILIAGDITLGAKSISRVEKNFIKLGAKFAPPAPVLLIPGNHDYPFLAEQLPFFPSNFLQMHGKLHLLTREQSKMKIAIVGFGGATIGLYNNLAFSEEVIFEELETLFERKKQEMGENIFTILLVHDPPHNTSTDFTYRKDHVGSKSIRKIIEKYEPELVVAGHIHESAAVDTIEASVIVNAGEAKYNKFAIIRIDEDGSDNVHVNLYESKEK